MFSIIHQGKPLSPVSLKLTRKQYYARLHNLRSCALIKRANGGYRLSSFGKVVFDWHMNLKNTISKEYWKLEAIDTLGSSGIPESEINKMLKALIGSENLRQLLYP